MKGQVVRIISNLYTVSVGNKLYDCRARGKFRNENKTPVVGDFCLIDPDNNYILELLERHNELKRPVVANVDIALIVTSVTEPKLSLNLLDKMLSIIIINKIKPVICLTKMDLLKHKEKKALKKIIKYYKRIGITIIKNKNIIRLKRLLSKKVVVLTGQTGAGKSSLLNKMDNLLNLQTGEISKALGRGKHTTRHVELFKIKDFKVVDTPGFSSLVFECTKEELKNSFPEFNKYKCKFKNCLHSNELDCEVQKAVKDNKILKSRYENYLSFLKEVTK